MADPLLEGEDEGTTPITAEERADLIPTHITLRSELNQVEQAGIDEAYVWAFSRKRDVLSEDFLRQLHKRMFKDVWKWAGTFRTSPRNIGVGSWQISTELRTLIDNVKFWIEHETYSVDEIGTRFHHKLVQIHPFPNGNGRFSRLATDLLMTQLGSEPFTWGSGQLNATGPLRKQYIAALKNADNEDITSLMEFVKT